MDLCLGLQTQSVRDLHAQHFWVAEKQQFLTTISCPQKEDHNVRKSPEKKNSGPKGTQSYTICKLSIKPGSWKGTLQSGVDIARHYLISAWCVNPRSRSPHQTWKTEGAQEEEGSRTYDSWFQFNFSPIHLKHSEGGSIQRLLNSCKIPVHLEVGNFLRKSKLKATGFYFTFCIQHLGNIQIFLSHIKSCV